MKKTTRAQRRLLHEMAKHERVILVQKDPQRWMQLKYSLNSFPMRTLNGEMVARLAQRGYFKLDRRGYYVLTAKGQLEASIVEQRSQE